MRQWLLSPCDTETVEGSVLHSLVKCHQKSEKYLKSFQRKMIQSLVKKMIQRTGHLGDDYDDVKLL